MTDEETADDEYDKKKMTDRTLDEEMKRVMGVVYTGASYKIQKEAFEKGKTAGAVNAGCCSCRNERDAWLGRANYLFDLLKEHGIIPERMDDAQCNASIEKIKQAGRDEVSERRLSCCCVLDTKTSEYHVCEFHKALAEHMKQAGRDEALKEVSVGYSCEKEESHTIWKVVCYQCDQELKERLAALSKEKGALEAEKDCYKQQAQKAAKEFPFLLKENARLRNVLRRIRCVVHLDSAPNGCNLSNATKEIDRLAKKGLFESSGSTCRNRHVPSLEEGEK